MKSTKVISLACTLFFLNFIGLQAQDNQAKSILDKLSKKAESYSSMDAQFKYTLINKADGINETQSGSLISQGEKYKVNIAGQIIISDGKTVWTIIEDAEEVQVNHVPTSGEEEDFVNPVSVLTLWEKGFKYKYDSKVKANGVDLDVINLYPEKPDEKSFHTVKLYINKAKDMVQKVEIKGKDGTDFLYDIVSFTPNKQFNASQFSFSEAKYPDFEVIDLR